MSDINEIADKADVIIDGFAFLKHDDKIDVVNLNEKNHAAVFFYDKSIDGESLIETSMDDIELSIAKDYLKNAKKYLEMDNA
ncbi:hypothetical protein [Treponema sp. C6A8]|uniref:DUF7723 family protein n=1 Tax=Treponema sp. C6A8 TaxID=1410609 RepID=UPI00048727E6|nr:hypothetical protein [Treponema sp. C6A8]